eukprot:scaffold135802_cov31-Tisochrysis_lutea.AAC.4
MPFLALQTRDKGSVGAFSAASYIMPSSSIKRKLPDSLKSATLALALALAIRSHTSPGRRPHSRLA